MPDSHQKFEESASFEEQRELWNSILQEGALSLSPNRDKPLAPWQIVKEFEGKLSGAQQGDVVKRFTSFLKVVRESYPRNIYWDLDRLVSSTIERGFFKGEFQHKEFEKRIDRIEDLMIDFGCKGEIRFEFIHDFTYGFDWVKWIQKSKPRHVAYDDPFQNEFLSYLKSRGGQILELIHSGCDAKYPQLKAGEFRNAYTYDRSREAEIQLMSSLVRQNFVPLKIWERDAKPVYIEQAFEKRRELSSGDK